MGNIKKYTAKKGTAKKSATRGKRKVIDTLAFGGCRLIVTTDDRGCMETRVLC